jgi:hypothetical protein
MGYSQVEGSTRKLPAAGLCLFLWVSAILAVGRPSCPTCITRSSVLWPSGTNDSAVDSRGRFAVTADLAKHIEGSSQNVSSSEPEPTWQELVNAVVDQGVPSNTSAQVSIALSSRSCTALQQQASQADACVRLESRQSLFVLLCMQPGNAEGALLIYSLDTTGAVLAQSHTPRARGNIYRIRVSGPEILQPAIHYCGTVAAAGFSVGYPGTYHLEVLQLYQGFNYTAPPFVLADIHAANHTFKATPRLVSEPAAAATGPHTQPLCQLQGAAEAAAAAERGQPEANVTLPNSTSSSSSAVQRRRRPFDIQPGHHRCSTCAVTYPKSAWQHLPYQSVRPRDPAARNPLLRHCGSCRVQCGIPRHVPP